MSSIFAGAEENVFPEVAVGNFLCGLLDGVFACILVYTFGFAEQLPEGVVFAGLTPGGYRAL